MIGRRLPDGSLNVLLEYNRVMFALFQVLFFTGTIADSNAAIVAVMKWITVFPGAVVGRKGRSHPLVGEGEIGPVGCEVRIECSTLAYIVVKRLIAIQNLTIHLGILGAGLVLLTFPGILGVAHLVRVGESLGFLRAEEAWKRICVGTDGAAVVHVLKFGPANEFLRATVCKCFSLWLRLAPHGRIDMALAGATRSWLPEVILTRIDVRITYRV